MEAAINSAEIKRKTKQLFQVLQDMENFLKLHIGDACPRLMREKLRFLHRIITPGRSKSVARGILTYYTRWSKMKILTKIVDLIGFLCKTNLNRDNLISEPYIYKDKILSTIDIIPFRAEKIKTLEIKQE